MTEKEVNRDDLVEAVKKIMAFCRGENMTELVAYLAMISITNTMEEQLGFGYERKQDA